MNHLDFLLWMLLFPLSMAVSDHFTELKYKLRGVPPKEYSETTEWLSAAIKVFFYVYIASKLF